MIYLISYLGLISGMIVAYFTKEEINIGQPYFRFSRSLILGVICFIFLEFLKLNVFITGALTFTLVAIEMFFRYDIVNYAVLAFISYLADSAAIFTLIFLYGSVVAAMRFKVNERRGNIIILVKNSIFLIIFFILKKLAWQL